VRLGLEPVLVGNSFRAVEQRRKDLRFPLPERFAERLLGKKVLGLDRRAKYLLARLDDGEVLVMHHGMTGRFSIARPPAAEPDIPKHEHIVFHLADGTDIRYSDARRFGYMDLIPSAELESHALFKGLGIEPLSADFTAEWLAARLRGKQAPIKSALVDQRLIAGLGNIYACEALYRAGISPLRRAGTLATATGKPTKKTEALVQAIKAVIAEAVKAGGSSLRNYVQADGRLGRFQHGFEVYGREGKACRRKGCGGKVRRIVQGGRSTFYCPNCQR
jgi:formamidopyrimidine-DNA glycosylase